MSQYPQNIKALLCIVLLVSGCKTELVSQLEQQQANEIMALLMDNDIVTQKTMTEGTFSLIVDENQFRESVELLKAHGLPRQEFDSMGDVFSTDGLVESPLQEWAKLNYALTQELKASISAIPGVVRADVHIATKRNENPFEDSVPPSASVLIQMNEKFITDEMVPQIKQLISFSIPDISYDRVGVIISSISTPEKGQDYVGLAGLIVHQSSVPTLRYLAILMIFSSVLALAFGGLSLFSFRKLKAAKSAPAISETVEADE